MSRRARRPEERREKIVRECQKQDGNKRCADCTERLPQYIITNFNTFVCTACSGVHREFEHRVKSISLSTFTEEEVEAVKNGGNKKSNALFMARHRSGSDLPVPEGGRPERHREFIKAKYVEKRWYATLEDLEKEAEREAEREAAKAKREAEHSSKQAAAGIASTTSQKKSGTTSGETASGGGKGGGGLARPPRDGGGLRPVQQPPGGTGKSRAFPVKPPVLPVKPPALPVKPPVDLLDFMSDDRAPATAAPSPVAQPPVTPATAAAASSQKQWDAFGIGAVPGKSAIGMSPRALGATGQQQQQQQRQPQQPFAQGAWQPFAEVPQIPPQLSSAFPFPGGGFTGNAAAAAGGGGGGVSGAGAGSFAAPFPATFAGSFPSGVSPQPEGMPPHLQQQQQQSQVPQQAHLQPHGFGGGVGGYGNNHSPQQPQQQRTQFFPSSTAFDSPGQGAHHGGVVPSSLRSVSSSGGEAVRGPTPGTPGQQPQQASSGYFAGASSGGSPTAAVAYGSAGAGSMFPAFEAMSLSPMAGQQRQQPPQQQYHPRGNAYPVQQGGHQRTGSHPLDSGFPQQQQQQQRQQQQVPPVQVNADVSHGQHHQPQQAFAAFGQPALSPHQQQQQQPLAQSGPPHNAGTAPGGFVPHYGAANGTPQNPHQNHHLQQQQQQHQQFRPQHQVPQQYPGAAVPRHNSPYPLQQQPPQPGYARQQFAGYSQTRGGGGGGGGGAGVFVPAAVAANQDPFAELTEGGGGGGNNGRGQGSGEDGKIQPFNKGDEVLYIRGADPPLDGIVRGVHPDPDPSNPPCYTVLIAVTGREKNTEHHRLQLKGQAASNGQFHQRQPSASRAGHDAFSSIAALPWAANPQSVLPPSEFESPRARQQQQQPQQRQQQQQQQQQQQPPQQPPQHQQQRPPHQIQQQGPPVPPKPSALQMRQVEQMHHHQQQQMPGGGNPSEPGNSIADGGVGGGTQHGQDMGGVGEGEDRNPFGATIEWQEEPPMPPAQAPPVPGGNPFDMF